MFKENQVKLKKKQKQMKQISNKKLYICVVKITYCDSLYKV